ncbi:FAD-dependent oxidoreductase [bacterium]|nr:FAD-dependent oxidoreductase [bacterium]
MTGWGLTSPKRHVAVIGAGVAGLVAAYRLLGRGHRVTLFERGDAVGGQLATTTVGGTVIERYYHHAFTTDDALWRLCDELGLRDYIRWVPSTMGYVSDGQWYPFGTLRGLWGFSPLGVVGRIQFVVSALCMLALSKRQTERYPVARWFKKWGFGHAWAIVWRPLFAMKFGKDADTIALTWLWGKLKTRGQSRTSGQRGEVLAYMDGSFGRLATTLADRIIALGGIIQLKTSAEMMVPQPDGAVALNGTIYDAVITTAASGVVAESAPWTPAFRRQLETYRYTAAICVMVISNRPWMPSYWTNVGDDDIPFGGVIEHTRWIDPTTYDGRHILYLSRYVDDTHALFMMPESDLVRLFLEGLGRICPDFDEAAVLEVRVFRQRNAQPIVPVGYVPPQMTTEVANIFWISTHHTYPYDRGINYAVSCAEQVVAGLV